MDDYTEQGHPTFVGRPNDAADEKVTRPPSLLTASGGAVSGTHGGSVKPAHSHTIRSALGARILRGQRCICGAIYEEVVGRIA